MPDGRDGRVVLIVQEELVTRMDTVDAFEEAGFKVFQVGQLKKPSSFSNVSRRSEWSSLTWTCRARWMARHLPIISASDGRRLS